MPLIVENLNGVAGPIEIPLDVEAEGGEAIDAYVAAAAAQQQQQQQQPEAPAA